MAAPKKREHDSAAPSAKRQKKVEQPSQPEKASSTSSDSKTNTLPKPTSILKTEEKVFPRGGGSVLTPQELKQVHIQAKQDVLFEQGLSTHKSKPTVGEDGESGDEFAAEDSSKKVKSKKDKRSKGKNDKSKKSRDNSTTESTIKPEGLSFKRLVEGSIVLGQITQVTRRDICLAIPNNLSGYVPVLGVSQQLSAKIQKALSDSDSEDDSGSESDSEDLVLALDQYFRIGQTLRAYVVSTEGDISELSTKSKRHIELSLEPQFVNGELNKSDLYVGCMIQAAVASVEDHGLVMDLGLRDASTRAFLPVSELEEGVPIESIHEGAVILCQITSVGKNGSDVKLTANHTKGGDASKVKYVTSTPSVKTILPGTPVELLITEPTDRGVVGKIMGMIDATADFIHSGGAANGGIDLEDKYSIGDRVNARVICTFPNSDPAKIGVSLLPHMLSLKPLTSPFKHSEYVEGVVSRTPTKQGLILNYEDRSQHGWVHVSRVHDKKLDTLSAEAAYKAGTSHKSRVIGFNPVDGLVIAAMDGKTLAQPYLIIEDVPVAEVVNGKIAKLLIKNGKVSGILVTLSDGITGFVPEMHFSDIQLANPEKRFREGQAVRTIVLSVSPFRRRIRLSLKKSLVNSDAKKFTDLSNISPGDQAPGTLIKVFTAGAIVKFFGSVRGFLPIAEMSEGYVTDAKQHFRTGQVVNVHVLNVEAAQKQLVVSCRDPRAFGFDKTDAFEQLKLGDVTAGTITESSSDSLVLKLGDAGIKALLDVSHLTDRSVKRNVATLKKFRVGQTISDLVVLLKNNRRNTATVSLKPSLVAASKAGELPFAPTSVVEGKALAGYVRGVSTDGVFVQFGGSVVGLVHKTQLPAGASAMANFGFFRGQSVSPRVLATDAQGRIQLSLRPETDIQKKDKEDKSTQETVQLVVNPVDPDVKLATDFELGRVVKVSVTSVKETQLNVRLADGIQGRVDVSEAFQSGSDITNASAPLNSFSKGQVISARVIGIHDARSHRFLPLSHRGSKIPVFELSIRAAEDPKARVADLASISVGSSYPVFVNNYGITNLWVSLSAGVRGSIDLLRLSDDVSRLQKPAQYYPVGSYLEATVTSVNAAENRLDLSVFTPSAVSLETLTEGSLLPGRVTKVTPRVLLVQLSESVSGIVPLSELSDDFDSASTSGFEKNNIIRVAVVQVDAANSKLVLSVRPSHILSSELSITDRHISSAVQLNVGDLVRGFISRIGVKGISVDVGPSTTGFVRLAELSDGFVKDGEWQKKFAIGQLIRGRVVVVDGSANRIQMSMKESVLQTGYVAPLTLETLTVGKVYPGKIRKVEAYGVFVVLDNTKNVSGLCHKSMLADGAVDDVTTLYDEGDRVKAMVISIDRERRRVNFGLKASLFGDAEMEVDEEEQDDEDGDIKMGGDDDEEDDSADEMGGVRLSENVSESDDDSEEQADDDSDDESEEEDSDVDSEAEDSSAETTAFDWTGASVAVPSKNVVADEVPSKKSKSKSAKSAITVDMTGSLDASGPQSTADFERLLLAEPNSSSLWIQYMAFFAQLGDIDRARTITRRALSTIHMRETDEKMNVWVAHLNLENSFGDESSLQDVFAESCKFNDSAVMHEKMATVLIESGKVQRARDLFVSMTKIRTLSATPAFWINYASFLLKTCNDAAAARALLKRSTQSVPERLHRELTIKFAGLEFKVENGDPERGRTIFEGLVTTFPNRGDIWDAWLALEKRGCKLSSGDAEESKIQIVRVRDLLVRMGGLKMKKLRAKKFFENWIEWEDSLPGKKGREIEKVKARAREYVEKMREEKEEREKEASEDEE